MMKTISQVDLEHVTGGKAGSLPTTGGDTSGTGNNDQLLTAIQGIQSSIKDLSKNQNQGLFSSPTGMMLFALAMSRRQEVVVYGGGGGGCRRGGYWYRSYW